MKFTPPMAQTAQELFFARANAIIGPKRNGYSPGADPFSNFRAARVVGVEDWRGALVRLLDKVGRTASLAANGNVAALTDPDDGLIGNTADLLNYTVLAVCLVIESLPEEQAQTLLSQLGFAP
jgi:hypothetical protein